MMQTAGKLKQKAETVNKNLKQTMKEEEKLNQTVKDGQATQKAKPGQTTQKGQETTKDQSLK